MTRIFYLEVLDCLEEGESTLEGSRYVSIGPLFFLHMPSICLPSVCRQHVGF